MKVVKKINNNVAVCLDNNGDELVAFGKGIGFPKMPYELTDLSKISMTFYKLNFHYYQLLKEIPAEIFEISATIVNEAQQLIPHALNPNLVFTLADHIHFAITRLNDYDGLQLPFSYDVEQLYPAETKVGYDAVKMINKQLKINLPTSEVTAIAMHLVNSQSPEISSADTATLNSDDLIEQATKIIEQQFDIVINRKSFTYNRFTMHVRFYIKRVKEQEQITENVNEVMFNTMKDEEPQIYIGAKRIADYIDDILKTKSTQDEIFYLMIYVKRIVNQETGRKKE